MASASTPFRRFILSPGDPNGQVPMAALTNSRVDGIVLRAHAVDLNSAVGKFNFTRLINQVKQCQQHSKAIAFDVFPGCWAPLWWCKRHTTDDAHGGQQPVVTDSDYQSNLMGFIDALGKQFNGLIEYIHVNGPTATSSELRLVTTLQSMGVTGPALLSAWHTATMQYLKSFPACKAYWLNLWHVFNNTQLEQQIADQFVKDCGSKAVIAHCELAAKTTIGNINHKLVLDYHSRGVKIGFEELQSSSDPRFGGTYSQAASIANAAGASVVQIYQGDLQYI